MSNMKIENENLKVGKLKEGGKKKDKFEKQII